MAIKTHIGFSISDRKDVDDQITNHFFELGYRLVKKSRKEWLFSRGSKLAVFWRFDIRAYATTLKVRAVPSSTGDTRVSCDWEVWTFMTFTTGADIATLEAEGRQLESLLNEH